MKDPMTSKVEPIPKKKTKVRIKVDGKNYVHSLFIIQEKYPDGSPKLLARVNDPRQLEENQELLTAYLQHEGNW